MNMIVLSLALCHGAPVCAVHGELTPKVVETIESAQAKPGTYTVVDGTKTYTITIKARNP